MATFLDVSILGFFGVVFSFLLVFVIIFGLLSLVKPFGDKQAGIYGIIAIAFAILSVSNINVLRMIAFVTPWFFILIFIGFIILFALMIFGWKMEDIAERATKTNMKTYVIVIIVVVIIFGVGNAFGQETLEAGTGQTGSGTSNTTITNNDAIVQNPGNLPDIRNTATPGTPESTATDDFGTNVLNTLINPQVLGMILIILVGAFAMFFLTKTWID